jgi:glycosyltransferase involved in cell wall biosynthesis
MPAASEAPISDLVDSKPAFVSARRALLFFLSAQDAYRRPLFSSEEVFCGPDAADRTEGGKIRAIRTVGNEPDVREILGRLPSDQLPEYVVVKADATGRCLPRNLSAVKGPKVLLVGDTHHMDAPIRSLTKYAGKEPFDHIVFDHTRHHARLFAESGFRNLHWLPALDYGFVYRHLRSFHSRPLTFVGQVGRFHPYRRWLLGRLKDAGLPLEVLHAPLEKTADIYADSEITLNVSLNGDLNLRVFEALAAGGFLLTDELAEDSGLRRLFVPGRHLDTWRTPEELLEKIRHYVEHPGEALGIRKAGQEELLRRHDPATKIRELETLIDGGAPNPLYDLRVEPWWPRGTAVVSPGLPGEIAAYEVLQESHRTARQLTVYAAEPQSLARFQNLPRLRFLPLAEMGPPSISAGLLERQMLWWDKAMPEETIARFLGEVILAPDEAAAARTELEAWGFVREAAGSPVFRLARPMAFLDRARKAGAPESVRFRLPSLIEKVGQAVECEALAEHASLLGERTLRQAALKRAVGLDRNATTALISLAAMTLEEGDATSVSLLLEEAARVGPLPPEAESLRAGLAARPGGIGGLSGYLRAIGRAPATRTGRPLRILVVTNLFPPQELGGYGRMMWEFARGLIGRGHAVRILTADQPGMQRKPDPDEEEMERHVRRHLTLPGGWQGGLPCYLEDREELSRRFNALRGQVDAQLDEFPADVVFAGNLDFLDTVPVDAALARGLPVLHALGNIKPGYGRAGQPTSARYWVAPGSDWNGRALLEGGYTPARIETLYPGARVDRFFRAFLPATGRLRICFAGIVLPYKGPHVLVDALARLHRLGVDFTAEIAGDTPDKDYFARLGEAVRAVGLADKVSFPGFLDRRGLSALFARSNVLVFPSTVPEAFGISQVEAMAAGLVVVSSGTGGASEIIRHNVDGLLFPSERADELARRLLSLVEDPALMARLQRSGQARSASFAVEHSIRRIERLFGEMLSLPAEMPPAVPAPEGAPEPEHAVPGF